MQGRALPPASSTIMDKKNEFKNFAKQTDYFLKNVQ